jgi:antitoxin ParD1/3/4
MARQSITFTKPNDEWLKAQVDSQEYSSKSEVVNDLIRRERDRIAGQRQKELEWIRAKLIEGEQSGFTEVTEKTRDELLARFKERAKRDGKI